MMFLTPIHLLRMLHENSPNLKRITHIIIDEVYKRSFELDYLLTLLRNVLKVSSIKLIITSSTFDAKLSTYFSYNSIHDSRTDIPGFKEKITI